MELSDDFEFDAMMTESMSKHKKIPFNSAARRRYEKNEHKKDDSDDDYSNLAAKDIVVNLDFTMKKEEVKKKKSSPSMISELNWSRQVGTHEIIKSQQLLYRLVQKSLQYNQKEDPKKTR